MLNFTGSLRVYLATAATDLPCRRSDSAIGRVDRIASHSAGVGREAIAMGSMLMTYFAPAACVISPSSAAGSILP